MKREEFLRYLRGNGCEFLREGSRHSWWHNPANNLRSSVPRHTEIDDNLIRKICKDLGIPKVEYNRPGIAFPISVTKINLAFDRDWGGKLDTAHDYEEIPNVRMGTTDAGRLGARGVSA